MVPIVLSAANQTYLILYALGFEEAAASPQAM